MKRSHNPKNKQEKPSQRQMAYDSLPPHIKENLTAEEVELFLNAEEWPESMFKKLDEFIFPC